MVYWVIGKAVERPSGQRVSVERYGPYESSEAAARVRADQTRDAELRRQRQVQYEVVRDYA